MLLQLTVLGLVLAVAIISSDAKLFKKKKKWLPKFLGLGLGHGLGLGNGLGHGLGFGHGLGLGLEHEKIPHAYEEHPRIVEIVKHVPVIQKVEVIKPIEIIKIVNVPGKLL